MTKKETVSIETVLCPTDFSDFSHHAIAHAAAIAEAWNARLIVLHVMPQTLMRAELIPSLDTPLVPRPEIEDRARARLAAFAGKVRSAGVVSETRLLLGEASRRILSEADKSSVDLIVLGTHGRSGFERFLLGSVAERVVRKARRPVLTVGQPPHEVDSGLPYRRILVAVDFSGSAMLALEHAVAFRENARGELLAVHVVEPGTNVGSLSAEERLVEACGSRRPALVVVEEGKPEREIRRVAAEHDSDLVIVGATGRGTLGPAEPGEFGSTAHAILRTAGRPVLTVRRKTISNQEEEH